jgi:hypothetical protein
MAMQDKECEFMDFGCYMQSFQDWLKDFLLYIYDFILSAIAGFLDLIPVPDFLKDLSASTISLPPDILFFSHYFMIKEGFIMIVSAYIARFILRRIPLIG